MKNVKYIIALSGILMSTSCDFLDVSPKDFVTPGQYYNTETDLNTALTGVYTALADANTYKGHMIGRMGLDADQGYDNRNFDMNTVAQYSVVPTDVKVTRFWQTLYAGINNANILLGQVDNSDIAIDATKRENIKGETLFLRAYYYFLLVSNFGDVPLILKSTNSAEPENINIARTPAKEVYSKIIEDMEEAALLVEDITDIKYGGRVNKSAVWGILARVHLFVAGEPIKDQSHYQKARNAASKVIELNYHELNPDYEQIFKNYAQDIYDTKESIWEVEFMGNGVGIYATLGGFIGGNNGIRNTFDYGLGYTYDFINATKLIYNLYQEGDLRRDHCIAPFYYKQPDVPAVKVNWEATQIFNRNCGKFRREYEILTPKHKSQTPQNFPLLRYSDVLLMFAEADNAINNGPTADAYNAINQVRRRGYGKDPLVADAAIDLSGIDYYDFWVAIQDERSRELAFESLRKGDLVRWGIFLRNMKQCLTDANAAPVFGDLKHAKSTFANISARDVLWPIPSYEIGVNPKLTQNPGW